MSDIQKVEIGICCECQSKAPIDSKGIVQEHRPFGKLRNGEGTYPQATIFVDTAKVKELENRDWNWRV